MSINNIKDERVNCLICGAKGVIRSFGLGFVGVCMECQRIIYNGLNRPSLGDLDFVAIGEKREKSPAGEGPRYRLPEADDRKAPGPAINPLNLKR